MHLCVERMSFFFSSRRRHTRLQGDWSSDVCSSDLPRNYAWFIFSMGQAGGWTGFSGRGLHAVAIVILPAVLPAMFLLRSTREGIYNKIGRASCRERV